MIASSHGVDTTEIARAREYRNRGVDFALVFLPMFVLLVMAAYGLSFRVLRRIPLHNPWLAAGGILLISLFVVIVWMQAGEVWTGMVEILRLGDSHLGYREFRLPWRRHAVQVGVIGLLLFWLVALFRYRRLRAAAAARASVTTEPR